MISRFLQFLPRSLSSTRIAWLAAPLVARAYPPLLFFRHGCTFSSAFSLRPRQRLLERRVRRGSTCGPRRTCTATGLRTCTCEFRSQLDQACRWGTESSGGTSNVGFSSALAAILLPAHRGMLGVSSNKWNWQEGNEATATSSNGSGHAAGFYQHDGEDGRRGGGPHPVSLQFSQLLP